VLRLYFQTTVLGLHWARVLDGRLPAGAVPTAADCDTLWQRAHAPPPSGGGGGSDTAGAVGGGLTPSNYHKYYPWVEAVVQARVQAHATVLRQKRQQAAAAVQRELSPSRRRSVDGGGANSTPLSPAAAAALGRVGSVAEATATAAAAAAAVAGGRELLGGAAAAAGGGSSSSPRALPEFPVEGGPGEPPLPPSEFFCLALGSVKLCAGLLEGLSGSGRELAQASLFARAQAEGVCWWDYHAWAGRRLDAWVALEQHLPMRRFHAQSPRHGAKGVAARPLSWQEKTALNLRALVEPPAAMPLS
jgi:hypothetical protein